MSTTEKFYFDKNNFDDPKPGEEEDLPPKVTLLEEEYEAEKKQIYETAYQKGKSDGQQATQQSIEAELADTLNNIGNQLSGLAMQEDQRNAHFEKESLAAAHQVFLSMFPSISEKLSLHEVEDFVREKLEENPNVSVFEIVVNKKLEQNLNERIQALPIMQAGKMKVDVVGTEDISEHDIRIKWADGGAKRSLTNVKAAIEKAFEEFLALDIGERQEMPNETIEEVSAEAIQEPVDDPKEAHKSDEKDEEVTQVEEANIVVETQDVAEEEKKEVEQEGMEDEKGLEDNPDKQ